jgi:pimeloyl-ACP methyl ester carboxylesterase/predicted MPP superfamily phosphohydrolase
LTFSSRPVNCVISPPDQTFHSTLNSETADVSFHEVDLQQQPVENFTIVALPDTQFYSESYPEVFDNQTEWIASNADSQNVVFVTHEGDIVNVNTIAQWENANRSLSKLDGHAPWAVLPGTHDGNPSNLANYNTYFNFNRFSGEAWYGGAYLNNNANSYELFSGGNDDYLIFHFQQSPSDSVLAWANTTIASCPNRRVLVTTHDYLNVDGSRTSVGDRIWQKFVAPNADRVFLVLCGHMHAENRRSDTVNGHTVYQLLADFQEGYPNGGNGWLRILDFRPAEDRIYVKTYSPYVNQYQTDGNSQFILDYDMTSDPAFTIDLESPENETVTIDNKPNFSFTATHVSQTMFSGTLWLQNTTYSIACATRNDVVNGSLTTLTPSTPIPNGDWFWWINCTDGSASGVSETRIVTISVFRGDKSFVATYDGSTRYYWLDMPDNFDNSTPTPLVFFLHGYGGSRNSYLNYLVLRQTFQNRTWIVAAVDCRENGGYDNWYIESTRQDITDILSILKHAYNIDSSHIHTIGNSMGGSGSLKYAMFNNEVVASLVEIHGVTNFTQFYPETDSTLRASLRAAYGGTPSQVPQVYANESALGNEYRFRFTPVMIMHGTLDNVVNVSHSRNLNQSLSALGYTVKYVEVQGAGHNMQAVINGREMEIFSWFNDHPLHVSHNLLLDAGWNMVSFPAIPSNTSFASIFNGIGYYQVLTWSGTSYVTPTNAEAGRGYWVLVLSSTTVDVTGMPVNSYERDLPAGWSMIGSICNSAVDASTVFPDYYQLLTWSGTSYVAATTIESGKGYWALVQTPTHIRVPPS